jgi:CBS domain-containing protein
LSALKGKRVTDGSGLSSRLVDLTVDLSTGDYPTVTRVLVPGDGGSLQALPAPHDLTPGDVRVPSPATPEPVDETALERTVLLRRDVLDALVLDLSALRAVRANDLWLQSSETGVLLVAADISPWGVVRRLTRGLVGRDVAKDFLDWKDVEFLRGDPFAAAAGRDYHRRVARLQAAQIVDLSDALPYMHAAELLTLLPDPLAADVLERMLPERQAQVATELDQDQAARLVAEMAPDAAADMLGLLELADATRLLEAVPPDRSRPIQDLLRFPPDTAGGIMTNEVVTAPVDCTVGEVLDLIRPELARPDFVYFIYLVEGEAPQRLRGVVTLRDLNVAAPETPVADIMAQNLVTVGPLEPALDAAHRLAGHGLNALPVVAADDSLLGIITVDKAMAQILPEAWRDRLPRVFS